MIKWLDELFKSFHPLFICAIISLAFMVGIAIDRLSSQPRPSPKARGSADKEPPHMVKVTIKYNDINIHLKDVQRCNIVDTEGGQRCTLWGYWGEPGDTFLVSSNRLSKYLQPPNKEQLKALHEKLIRNELEEQLKDKGLEPQGIKVNVIPLSDKDKEEKP